MLWTDDGPHFVDLDDCVTGPAVQDLWMLLSGGRTSRRASCGICSRATREFGDFDYHEVALIEPLRTLRIMHYAGWLARRWDDPAFPRAFPWFEEPKYWEQHVLDLREQIAAMEEAPLTPLAAGEGRGRRSTPAALRTGAHGPAHCRAHRLCAPPCA